jgi:hypothetical protein
MIEKLENPLKNDKCSCGWKGCLWCDEEYAKKRDTEWHTCKYCGYDDRDESKKIRGKWCMDGVCNACRLKKEREREMHYAKEEGKTTREDEILCPYCGFAETDELYDYRDGDDWTCPECDKKCDLSVEVTYTFTASKKEE